MGYGSLKKYPSGSKRSFPTDPLLALARYIKNCIHDDLGLTFFSPNLISCFMDPLRLDLESVKIQTPQHMVDL